MLIPDCLVQEIHITIKTKTASITCNTGRVVNTSVIVGAKNTPTPIGSFSVLAIDTTGQVGFLRHQDGSYYAIHQNKKSLPQNGSLGCVRIPDSLFKSLKFNYNTKIVVQAKNRKVKPALSPGSKGALRGWQLGDSF